MSRIRPPRLLVALLALGVTLTGCTSTVTLQPAEGANDPACARITAFLPDSVAGQQRRWTDAQATGAWGDPVSVILSCGVPAPAVSELPCQTVDGVDWLIDDSEAPNYRFTTFGREPAVQVYVDYDVVASFDVLSSLSKLVGKLPRTAQCTERPGT